MRSLLAQLICHACHDFGRTFLYHHIGRRHHAQPGELARFVKDFDFHAQRIKLQRLSDPDIPDRRCGVRMTHQAPCRNFSR